MSVRSIVIFSGSSHVSDSSALASNSLLLKYSFFGIEISVVTRAGQKESGRNSVWLLACDMVVYWGWCAREVGWCAVVATFLYDA